MRRGIFQVSDMKDLDCSCCDDCRRCKHVSVIDFDAVVEGYITDKWGGSKVKSPDAVKFIAEDGAPVVLLTELKGTTKVNDVDAKFVGTVKKSGKRKKGWQETIPQKIRAGYMALKQIALDVAGTDEMLSAAVVQPVFVTDTALGNLSANDNAGSALLEMLEESQVKRELNTQLKALKQQLDTDKPANFRSLLYFDCRMFCDAYDDRRAKNKNGSA